jgi:hypothetical protein
MFIDKLAKEIAEGSDRTTDQLMIKSMILYYGCLAMNRYNIRNPDESRANYFTMIFSGSGSGKSFLMSLIQDIFESTHNGYCDELRENFEKFNKNELEDRKSVEQQIYKRIPIDVVTPASGSVEGMYAMVQAIEKCQTSSLNILSDEFLDTLSENKAILNKMKEAYDSKFTGKVIKGTKDDVQQNTITEFSTAVCVMGSKASVDQATQEILIKLANTGFFRRTIIIDSKMEVELKREERTDISSYMEHLKKWTSTVRELYENQQGNKDAAIHLSLSSHEFYSEQLHDIKKDLFKVAKDNIMIEGFQHDKGAENQVKSMATIVAYLDASKTVEEKHLKWAYDFFRETRKTSIDTFRKQMPQYEVYELLLKASKSNQELSSLELKTMTSIPVSMANKRFDEIIGDARMMAYQNNYTLKQVDSENMGTRYSISELPTTNLEELIVGLSYSKYQEPRNSSEIAYEDLLISWKDIETLCLSDKKDSYTNCWFIPSDMTNNKVIYEFNEETEEDEIIDYQAYGHRRKENAISKQNMIIFDIDNGMTIEQAKDLLYEYRYFIYTTKSHRKEKANGEDRFRILLPTSREFEVTPSQHKLLYKAIEDFLCLNNNDPKTRNMGRLFYTNPNAEYSYKHDSEHSLDVTAFIPDTKKFNELMASYEDMKKLKSGETTMTDDETGRRINALCRWAVKEIMEGTLKDTLYRVVIMMHEMGLAENEVSDALDTIKVARGYPQSFNDNALERYGK